MNKSEKSLINYTSDFLEYLDVEKGLSLKSQETYGEFLKKLIFWLKKSGLESIKPHQLTKEHIWRYRLFLSHSFKKNGQPIKKSTQNYYLIVLRNLLKYFSDRDILALSAEKVKLSKLKSSRQVIKFLNLEQIEKLLQAPNENTLTGVRDKAILETLFSTGLRVAELTALNKEQIKLGSDAEDLEVVVIGKGNKPRPVYFSKRTLEQLKKYMGTRQDKDKALFIGYKGPKRHSKRLSARSIENIVKKYALLSGIPIFTTPHTLRHSFATDLLTQGVDLKEIQEFLGHKSIATTQIYVHVTNKKLREIHRKFHSDS